jgi:60 kDa SS-A/Ro ribonucleoprotein
MSKKNAYTAVTNAIGAKTEAKKVTPQTKVIPGRKKDMTRNNAGGVSFKVDMFTQLDRFLILGSEGGFYYATENKLTAENAKNVLNAIKADGVRVVNRVVEISAAGRAPKNDPALLVLALAMTQGDAATKEAAVNAFNEVARIGTHVFHFAEFINGMTKFNGKNTAEQRAIRGWFTEKTAMQLAQQITKYAQRDGWAMGDLIRLAHPKPPTPEHDALFAHAVGKEKEFGSVTEYMNAVAQLKATTDVKTAIRLINEHRLPREVVPTNLLNEPAVWEAMLPHMGITAMVRNLATMTRNGFMGPTSAGTRAVLEKMANKEVVQKSKIHPLQVLSALLTYKAGRSARGTGVWSPISRVVDGLDSMYDASFGNVTPTGKRIGIFLDVSASMTWSDIAGIPGLTPRVASAALAMVTMRTEQEYVVAAFTSRGYGYSRTNVNIQDGITSLPLSGKQRLDDVCNSVNNLPAGGTDCSLPMEWARENKIDLDAFLIYTDSDTYAGRRHPVQALQAYRNERGIAAKTVVVGMLSNGFTIADPNDAGMMDVVGFDTATPDLMSGFIRGDF